MLMFAQMRGEKEPGGAGFELEGQSELKCTHIYINTKNAHIYTYIH